jgi:hypothetical protein
LNEETGAFGGARAWLHRRERAADKPWMPGMRPGMTMAEAAVSGVCASFTN